MLKHLPSAAIVLIIAGALFKRYHLPGFSLLFAIAWVVTLVAIIRRSVLSKAIAPREIARGLFALGFVSAVVIHVLLLPGRDIALAMLGIGLLGMLWYDRGRIFPGKGDGASSLVVLYTSLVLIILGVVFWMVHWSYGTAMVVGGLVLLASSSITDSAAPNDD